MGLKGERIARDEDGGGERIEKGVNQRRSRVD